MELSSAYDTHDKYDNQDVYDVIVVGASFAGLSFAGVAAARGLRVLVLERDAAVGHVVRTTGVLFSDVLDVLDVPAQYLMNSVRQIRIQTPDQKSIAISAKAFRFYMADVTGLLNWMAEEARARGATIRCGSPYLGSDRTASGFMRVLIGSPSANTGGGTASRAVAGEEYARFLVGADGAGSAVARSMGLDQNTRFLAGAEWLIQNVKLDRETFYLAMDHKLAPGYCVWLAPHGDIAALGVAGHRRAFKPIESLQVAQTIFKDVADLSKMQVVERKAGVIPTGGKLRKVYRDDERGRVLLLGDAAGLCGAATGGGIYPALVSGRLAGQAVSNEVLNGTPGAVKHYLRDFAQAGRMGQYLQIEDWLRWVLDRMGSNADLAMLYGLFGSPHGHLVLQQVLLETPIISMDNNLFAMLRNLLGRHPSIYGSVFRSALRRVVARA
ncbi:MAG: FAD-dependent monooxygenase [Ktedonobacterales bacterium]